MKASLKVTLAVTVLLLILIIYFYGPVETSIETKDIGETHLAGDYQIQLQLSPEKPKIGNNEITFLIRDANDHPITQATLQVYAEMPAMGSMQAMREVVTITNNKSGVYQGRFSLPMNGSWPLTMTVSSKKMGLVELLFDMNTSRKGVKLREATSSHLLAQGAASSTPEQQLKSLKIDNYRRQLIGVTLAEVSCQKMKKTIRVGARVTYDQSRLTDITLKYDAWIGKLNADHLGKSIQKGNILFTVYSPDLVSLQNEYLDSLKQTHILGLRKATRQRLALWDVKAHQINSLAKRGRARQYLPIESPVNGTIIEKNVVTGSAIKAGQRVLQIADLSTVWIEGEIYDSDLPWLEVGMPVKITLSEPIGQSYTTSVTFIDSVVDPITRSTKVRAELLNPNGILRPGMYVAMGLQVNLSERMVVPEQAVIYSGEHRIVFVDKENGRLLPVKIKTGVRNVDMIEVIEGLTWEDRVVTSGNFLIAAESKLKAGLAQW